MATEDKQISRIENKLDLMDTKLDAMALDVVHKISELDRRVALHEQADTHRFANLTEEQELQTKRMRAMLVLMVVMAFLAGGAQMPLIVEFLKAVFL